jgi:hypothetical protein
MNSSGPGFRGGRVSPQRSAAPEIALMGDSGYAVRSNLGVVPLINLRLV